MGWNSSKGHWNCSYSVHPEPSWPNPRTNSGSFRRYQYPNRKQKRKTRSCRRCHRPWKKWGRRKCRGGWRVGSGRAGGSRRACWAATRVWVVGWRKTKRYKKKKKKRNRNGFSVRLGIWVWKIRFRDRSRSWISRNLNSWLCFFLLFLKENTIQIGMCNSINWKEREAKVRSGTIWERAYLRLIDRKKEQREPVESDHSKREREREFDWRRTEQGAGLGDCLGL